ncbi:hypothetical protein CORC01_07489 [Colletotrichum orchidophilum]|uniref:Lysine-specific metallo-endopeptidase domain-containing protein n=1 Tax=Colletotrichum orchidophilum TaxID=1209926 RepID=A0A1G4B7I9_9PEZI|nr:uncharacterized protein CORC01_07489 [Colletotrichum orchidophilum]OHE97235.1 hypothetical protein CORC01_07489 [Colletotrichum orchidophilum]
MHFSIRVAALSILSTLSFWHVFAIPDVAPLGQHASTPKRSFDSWVSVGHNGHWPCTFEQLDAIDIAVEYTKLLASAAIVALDHAGTRSTAYLRWFGKNNTSESDRLSIKTNHYDAVISQLRGPDSGTVKSIEEGGPNPKRLVYACPAASSPLCSNKVAASVINFGDEGFKVNLLYVCPPFFQSVSYHKSLYDWQWGRYTPSAGMILLHEMQHLDAVVGADRRSFDHAYSVSDCEHLDDSDKLTNAQNYAFFALDVNARPPK